MHLIWLTPEFPSSRNNTKGIYIYRTVRELAKHYQIHVICLYPAFPPLLEMLRYWKDWRKILKEWKKNYINKSEILEGLKKEQVIYLNYYRLPRGIFHHFEGWLAYLQAKKILSKIITKDSIIHANWIFPAGTMASIISQKFDVPFLISLLGSDVNRLVPGTKFWKAAKILLHKAHKVTSVTEDLIEKCNEKNIPIEHSKTEIISNIYDTNKFEIKNKKIIRDNLRIDSNQKMILYAGGLIPLKNVDVLIKAVSRIFANRSDICLYIAGSGSEEGILKRLVEKQSMKAKVFFVGSLISEDLINYYNAADVFCLPSKSEGLPNVIVESFFCGTPVVASAVGGIPSIVKEGINGFLVKPNSVEDLQEKLKISLDHAWDRKTIRDSVSFLFPEKVIEKYHKIYQSLSKENQKK